MTPAARKMLAAIAEACDLAGRATSPPINPRRHQADVAALDELHAAGAIDTDIDGAGRSVCWPTNEGRSVLALRRAAVVEALRAHRYEVDDEGRIWWGDTHIATLDAGGDWEDFPAHCTTPQALRALDSLSAIAGRARRAA